MQKEEIIANTIAGIGALFALPFVVSILAFSIDQFDSFVEKVLTLLGIFCLTYLIISSFTEVAKYTDHKNAVSK